MTSLTGGCLCGAVRYRSDVSAPLMTAVCHCKHCQKQSGTAFSIVVSVPADSLHVEGELSTFEDVGSSGRPVFRRFCGRCGSPVVSDLSMLPKLRFLKAGTLDDVSGLKPQVHVWCESAQPWVSIDPAAPSFPQEAPRRPKP